MNDATTILNFGDAWGLLKPTNSVEGAERFISWRNTHGGKVKSGAGKTDLFHSRLKPRISLDFSVVHSFHEEN
jgi:hypothetical protein